MKINYFDLGLHKEATEIDMFINICKKNQLEYRIYGFEAHPEYSKLLLDKYQNDSNVLILNKAISNKNGSVKLYISEPSGGEGNSIFSTKNNVHINKHFTVDGILFSDWIAKNVPNYKIENNIIRFNIEGAEWYLMDDLDKSNIFLYFKLFLGATSDMYKVRELKNKYVDYNSILNKHNVTVHRFVNIHRHLNCDLSTLIKTNFHE